MNTVQVKYKGSQYYRKSWHTAIRWYDIKLDSITDGFEEELEKEYQKLINPNKTLNPYKRGFDLTKAEIETLIECLYKAKNTITCDLDKSLLIVKLDQANGETPEEANPVGQTVYTLSEIWEAFEEIITKQGIDVMLKTALAMLPRHIKFNRVNSKPLETTKEQPNEELCHCGSICPENGCGSMWCPNDSSN